MTPKEMTNDGLLFTYFTNKKQMDELYRAQKELEEEIHKRIPIMKDRYLRGELRVKKEEDESAKL
jgi:hypothetical protein